MTCAPGVSEAPSLEELCSSSTNQHTLHILLHILYIYFEVVYIYRTYTVHILLYMYCIYTVRILYIYNILYM